MGNTEEHDGCEFTGLQPTYHSVDQEILRSTLIAITHGLETTRSCLVDHDASLGRTTRKNRIWAETMEGDIRLMERSVRKLREVLGFDFIAIDNQQ